MVKVTNAKKFINKSLAENQYTKYKVKAAYITYIKYVSTEPYKKSDVVNKTIKLAVNHTEDDRLSFWESLSKVYKHNLIKGIIWFEDDRWAKFEDINEHLSWYFYTLMPTIPNELLNNNI